MSRIILIVSGLLLFISIHGQNEGSDEYNSDILNRLKSSDWRSGEVIISMDEGIEDNFYKHLIYNNNNFEALGYRIRIFTSTGSDAEEKAKMERSRFLRKYDDIDAYLEYEAPDYEVYVGDCRTWSEVLKLFYKIKKDFPNSFPVPQPIKVDEQ